MANGTLGVSQLEMLTQSGTGTITIVPPATNTNRTLTLPDEAGTLVTTASLPNPLTSETAIATTSGTAIDFTGIPSWAKRITLLFSGVSTNGASNWLVRIGNGSIISTGYSSSSTYFTSGGVTTQSNTSGFFIRSDNAANFISGAMVIYNISGDTWVETWVGGNGENTQTHLGGGQLALGGVLDRIQLTTLNGTDIFDAGLVNIMYE